MKSEVSRDDTIGRLVNSAASDRAPEGFAHNVMSRIELEQSSTIETYKNPIGPKFLIVSTAVLLVLLLIASTLNLVGWPESTIFKFIKFPPVQLPDYKVFLRNIMDSNILIYLLSPMFLVLAFYVLDNLLYDLFRYKNKRA
ncbi:MAG: hypothetical protein V2I37_12870 [Marinilabiliaceae bacterium]|jgi:hypothetical protein|nr:hypothetical protein [Marinilabiliaceae bacterium]